MNDAGQDGRAIGRGLRRRVQQSERSRALGATSTLAMAAAEILTANERNEHEQEK